MRTSTLLVPCIFLAISAAVPAHATPIEGNFVADGTRVRIGATDSGPLLVRRLVGLTCIAGEAGLTRSRAGGWSGKIVCGASDWRLARPKPSADGASAIARINAHGVPLELPDEGPPAEPKPAPDPSGDGWEVVPLDAKGVAAFEMVRVVAKAGDPIALRLDGLIAATNFDLVRTGDTFASELAVDGGYVNVTGIGVERLRVPGALTTKKVAAGQSFRMLGYWAFTDAPSPPIAPGTTCVADGAPLVGSGRGWVEGVAACGEQFVTGRIAVGKAGAPARTPK